MSKSSTGAYSFKAKLWIYPGGNAAWHFITVPKAEAEKIKKKYGKNARGWGSLPVKATIGKTVWTTSIFPDGKAGTYLLPVKALVRRAEGVFEGEILSVSLRIQL